MDQRSTILVLLLCVCIRFSNAQHYNAVVLEYAPTWDQSTSDYDNMLRNVEEYVHQIQRAAGITIRADVIVFPEYGLTTFNLPQDLESVSTTVPTPSETIVPCTNRNTTFSKGLIDFSCAARTHKMYVVVNLIESETSSENTTLYYNTNVVFDRDGAVIARYRKINLYGEPQFTAGNEISTFRTDFGVTFGLATCFDLLFKKPMIEMINDFSVTDIIYPNAWFSETPFMSALSIQDGFAKAAGVNLLSSSYSSPRTGNAGAGIFWSNSTIGKMDLTTASTRNLLSASVPIGTQRTPEAVCANNINPSPRLGFPDIDAVQTRVENMEHYTFLDLPLDVSEIKEQVCSEGSQFCCDFYIEFSAPLNSNSTVYKLAAFFGNRGFNGSSTTIGLRNCAVVACTSSDSTSCGQRPSNINVSFKTISISANLPKSSDPFYMPSTLARDLRPYGGYTFCQNTDEDDHKVTMTSEYINNLLTFGIFGRVFDNDNQEVGKGDASFVTTSLFMLVTSLVAHLVIK